MTDKTKYKTPNPFEKECQAIYNQAIDHAIGIVKGWFHEPLPENLINSLNSLKKI